MRASLFSVSIFFALFSPLSYGKTMQQTLENILTLGDPSRVLVSAEMRRVSDNKVLFSYHSQRPLSPASTMKVLLSAALLAKLGSSFRTQTTFYQTGRLKDGRVQGDLIVVGGGDPFLVSEELFLIASELRMKGYKEFTGDLVLDHSLFVHEAFSLEQNKSSARVMRAFDAPVSALGVNFNALTINVTPSKKAGQEAIVNFEPLPLKGITLKNLIQTVSKGPTHIEVEALEQKEGGDLELTLSGQIHHASSSQRIYRSLPLSEKLAGIYIRSFFNQMGIEIHGKIREGRRPANAELILTHDSRPLADLVKSVCQHSSNYMADVLLKLMAVEEGRPGTFGEGVKILTAFMDTIGNKDPFVLKDGSGLSFQTRLSAEQLTKILLYAAHDFRIFPDFLASLPSGGESGSLKDRFVFHGANDLRGNVRAKTGTLSQPVVVSALAGYVQDPTYGLVSFAFIQNGVPMKPQPSFSDLKQSQEQALAIFGKKF